ncbi:MAG: methionyl-tRNA formyltransferase [Pseudolabrys sp.]|nr:methionyl-tRNA formyltransferase [Pseudolabrys sp.]
MGTPDFAVPALIELHARGHDIAAVYTRAAKPAGRGMALQETPVAREAARLGLPVLTPVTLKDKGAQDVFASHKAETAVVVAYGLILPKAVLDAVPLGCFNIHASLLPRWRGAAPINRAIMAGDAASGISIMKMDEGLDTGAVVNADRIPIRANMTAGELHDELARLGAELMARSLEALARGTLTETPQPEDGVTYAAKLSNEETRIDWARPAQVVHDHIRGLSPFPGAWCECEGARLKVLRSTRADGNGEPGTALDDKLTIACRAGAVRLTQLQRAGKQPMAAEDFLRGNPVKAGASLA